MESEEISPVADAQSLLNRIRGQAPVDGIESAGRTIDVLLNRLRLCFDGGMLPPIIFMNMHRYDAKRHALIVVPYLYFCSAHHISTLYILTSLKQYVIY